MACLIIFCVSLYNQLFYRCHFEYSPNEDKQFPKGETGLSFQSGDIVEILDQSDADWWQVITAENIPLLVLHSLSEYFYGRLTFLDPEESCPIL